MVHKHSNDTSEQLAGFAHDLRNCLTVLYSYADILEASSEKKGNAEDREAVQGIIDSIKDMDALISKRIDALNK